MVYKTSWLASSLDYADKTQLATTTERRAERSLTVLFRVLLDSQVRGGTTVTTTAIVHLKSHRRRPLPDVFFNHNASGSIAVDN